MPYLNQLKLKIKFMKDLYIKSFVSGFKKLLSPKRTFICLAAFLQTVATCVTKFSI